MPPTYTVEQQLEIGHDAYEGNLTKREAMTRFGISETTLDRYIKIYREKNNLPPRKCTDNPLKGRSSGYDPTALRPAKQRIKHKSKKETSSSVQSLFSKKKKINKAGLKQNIQRTNPIRNYDVYLTRMQKSMYDKIFFVDKIFDPTINTILDFGCADGELFKYIHAFWPELRMIGYDTDSNMIARARENVPFAEFYTDWDDIEVDPSHTILNLSSVIHEVWSYSSGEELYRFEDRAFKSGFRFITVRDMFAHSDDYEVKIRASLTKIVKMGYGEKLKDFEAVWGRIRDDNQLVHFLLKYRYKENWEREVQENYMPMIKNDFVRMMESYGYKKEYEQFAPLPYIVDTVRTGTGIDIGMIPTHLRAIFKQTRRR